MAKEFAAQEGIWDDSVLLDSWNEAFEEYKKYHSLAAQGKKVHAQIQPEPTAPNPANGDTAVETGVGGDEYVPTDDVSAQASSEAQPGPAPAVAAPFGVASIPPAISQGLMGNDEAMKNLVMSWYYAGYYTGLYEGKQQGWASAMEKKKG